MRKVWQAVALVFTLGLLTSACEQVVVPEAETSLNAATDDTAIRLLGVTERKLQDFKRIRGEVPVGWASELMPGTGNPRRIEDISDDLHNLSIMRTGIEHLTSEKASGLRAEILQLTFEDCQLLLKKSRSQQDIWGLQVFVRHAKDLDLDLDIGFGVKVGDLRKEALVMAKKEIAVLRPRIAEGSGDAVEALHTIYSEWGFTAAELGLTAKEVELLRDR